MPVIRLMAWGECGNSHSTHKKIKEIDHSCVAISFNMYSIAHTSKACWLKLTLRN